MSEPSRRPGLITVVWHACLSLLGSCLVLWLVIEIIAQIWGWLLLGAVVLGAGYASIVWLRHRRNRW